MASTLQLMCRSPPSFSDPKQQCAYVRLPYLIVDLGPLPLLRIGPLMFST